MSCWKRKRGRTGWRTVYETKSTGLYHGLAVRGREENDTDCHAVALETQRKGVTVTKPEEEGEGA